ncbi:MAG: pilus assembly protein PilM [Candidatus Omnitrophica bacterium]|nr:pilus assembly protein PilM [Candidatus Omnitrophota bacterium]
MKIKQPKPKSKKAIFVFQATDSHIKVLKCLLLAGSRRQIAAIEVEPLPRDIEDAGLSRELSGIFKRMQYNGEPVIVSLPRNQVTSRYLKVPATNPIEVEQMVTLQTVRFLPYPANELTSGFQIIGTDSQGYSEVNLVIAHKNAVERYIKIFKEIKVSLSLAVLSSVGLSQIYYYLEPKDTGPAMLIDIDGNQAEVAIVEGQRLFFSRSFKVNSAQPDWTVALIDEIAKTNDLYLKEVAKPLPGKALILGVKKGRFQELADNLRVKLKLEAEEFLYTEKIDFLEGSERVLGSSGVSLATLIGLSLAPVADSLNILPTQIKQAARLKFKHRERLQIYLSFIVIAAVFIFGMSRSLENKTQYLKKLKLQLNKVSKEARPLEEIEKRFQVIERYSKSEASCLDVLYELYNNIPADISLVSFAYEDNGAITIHGQAPALASVFNFVGRLEKAPAFRRYNIKVRYATKKATITGEVIDFEIVC